MDHHAFEYLAEPWQGTLEAAASKLGSRVAKRLGPDKPAIYFVEKEGIYQPPTQVWCHYFRERSSAFVITSPKVSGAWGEAEASLSHLDKRVQYVLGGERDLSSTTHESHDAFAYVIGPHDFMCTTHLEWVKPEPGD